MMLTPLNVEITFLEMGYIILDPTRSNVIGLVSVYI